MTGLCRRTQRNVISLASLYSEEREPREIMRAILTSPKRTVANVSFGLRIQPVDATH